MSNSYFRFKEFTINQENCANKVSTDACVFGAFIAKLTKDNSVLDIGCGSALLSLIVAQKGAKDITGIEIDTSCATQAEENVINSPYSHLIKIVKADASKYSIAKAFDWIISNPPFFNNSYKSADALKNKARQIESLSPSDWRYILKQKNCTNSTIAMLLSNNDVFESYKKILNELGFTSQSLVKLLDKEDAKCKRVILLASKKNNLIKLPRVFIYKNTDGSYTDAFIKLLKPYYLYL